MKNFSVPVVYQMVGRVTVQAENEEDLKNKLKDSEFVDKMPLPTEAFYLDESYEIDWEGDFKVED